MSELEKKSNVENVAQSKWSVSRVELVEIQNEINKAISSTPNPSKAPLNYIDNMEEREKSQKEYEQKIIEKQIEIAEILQASETKDEELSIFREEKAKLDIELQKTIWSLYNKLIPHIDFLSEVANKINEWMQSMLNSDLKWQESPQEGKKYNVKVKINEDWSQEDKSKLEQDIFSQLKEQWITPEQVILSYEIKSNEEQQNDSEELNTQNEEDSQNIPYILQLYFQLTSKDFQKYFKPLLDDIYLKWMQNLMENVKDLEEKYKELQHQSHFLSEKINELEYELSDIDESYIKCENDKKSLNEDKEKRDQTYFLDSYKSTKKVSLDDFVASPIVTKQINHILNLYKKWLSIPKTILLYWWHNLWKTYAANVLSSQLWLAMYHIKSYDIFNSEYSDPAEMLKAIFHIAIKKNEPCIIFLDEMEKFIGGAEWSPYQKILENTLRHHISKIKESNREIIIIWALSEWWKLDPNLLKQDVFQKQIVFEKYWENECRELLQQILRKKGLNLWDDINLNDIVSKISSLESQRNPEYIKNLVDVAEDCHLLDSEDPEFENTIFASDIQKAIELIKDRNRSNTDHIWY